MLYNSLNPHGGDIYTHKIDLDFSANINPLGTPPGVLSAMQESLAQSARYPDPFCREAISAVSAYEGVSPEDVLIGNGAAELIYSFCQTVTAQKALIPVPTFSEYESALKQNGCIVIHPCLKPENKFEIDKGFCETIEEQKPDVIFLCNPNNPIGNLADPDLMNKIISLCENSKIKIFVDECFMELTGKNYSVVPQIAEHSSLIVLKALTESYGLAGVRAGYCLSSDHDLLYHMSQTVQPWNVSVVAQAAIPAALKDKNFLEKSVSLIKEERKFLAESLTDSGLAVMPSDANFLLFKAPAGLDLRLMSKGIAIRNCSNFAGLGPGWYRIAVRRHEENEILIQMIRQILEEGK